MFLKTHGPGETRLDSHAGGAVLHGSAPVAEDPGERRFSWTWVGLLVLLGAVLRLYRLQEQSIWLDEYPNVLYLNAPDLHTYLTQMRLYLPEQAQAPFYYCVLYSFAHLFGDSVPLLRVLSIAIGLTSIPLVFLLGRYLARTNAGLVAALCLALSPQHIWYSQEIRPSPLVAPLVILSLYALFRALREPGGKWWLVNVFSNILLLETQLLTVFVLPVEALLACFYLRRRFKVVALWTVAHALFIVWWTVSILRMPASYTDEFKDLFVSGWRIAKDMLLDDVVNFHDHLIPAWKTGNPVHGLTGAVLPWRSWADSLFIAATAVVLSWYVFALLRKTFRWWKTRRNDDCVQIENGLFLCALIAVPVASLGLASWGTGKPYQAANYAYYNSVGLYIVIGAVLSQFSRRAIRAAAVTLLAALYCVQLALLLPGTTREDWLGASKYIMAKGAPDDLVLELNLAWPNQLLAHYFQDTAYSARRVSSLYGAFEQMDHFFNQPAHASGRAWLVFEHCFFDWGLFPGFDLGKTTEEALAARNLTCRQQVFPGHYDLVCLEVARKPGPPPSTVPAPVPPMRPVDFESLRKELRIPAETEEVRQAAIDGLRRRLNEWPPYCKFFLVVDSLDALAAGDASVAEGLARYAVDAYPRFGLARYALGMALFRTRGSEAACVEFEQAFVLDGGLKGLLGPLADALCNGSSPSAVQSECARLRRLHMFCADAFDTLAAQ